MTEETIKREYLRQRERAYDDRLSDFKAVEENHSACVHFVVNNWDIITWGLSRTPDAEPNAIPRRLTYQAWNNDIVEAMAWVRYFVSHEIHDDGEPAIVWMLEDSCLDDNCRKMWDNVPAGTPGARPTLIISPYDWSCRENPEGMFPHAIGVHEASDMTEAVKFLRDEELRINDIMSKFNMPQRSLEPSNIQKQLMAIVAGLQSSKSTI